MLRGLGFKFKGVPFAFNGSTSSKYKNMGSTKDAKDLEFHKLEWSATSFKVSDFLTRFTLPQIVKVIEGFYGDDEDSSLGADQILSLHCIKSTDKVVGRDYRGKEVNIPLRCQNKVEVRPSNLKDVYESVEELCAAFPRFVRISQGYYSATTDEELLNVGDKLQLKSIDKSKKGEEKLICINQNGQTIELPKDCVAGFQPLADGKEYFLAEVMAQFPMPLYVQFVDPPIMGKQSRSVDAAFFNSSLGAIYLESSYTENIIIASTISNDGKRTVVTFPREIDIRLAVCEGMLQNTVAYAEICQALNHGMDLKHLTLIDTASAFAPRNSVREYLYKELIDPATAAESLDLGLQKEVSPYEEIQNAKVEVNNQKPKVDDKKVDDKKVDDKKVDNKQVEADDHNPEIIYRKPEVDAEKQDVKQLSDYENQEWVEEKSQENSESKQAPPKPERSLKTSVKALSSVKEERDSKNDNSSLSSQSDDSELPKIEITDADDMASKRIDISHYTVRNVSEILKELGMDRYIVKFEAEMIDGEMLLCLDNDILMTDFGMNKLHCMKLKKYLEGWRPKV